MKTKIISNVIGCLLLLLTTNSSFTQVTANRKEFNKVYAVSANPKSNFTNSDNTPVNTSLAINNKLQKSFAQYFAGATGQNWSKAGINFFTSFYVNGVDNHALFDKRGHLIYSISYGSEKDLPADVRKIIKSEYYDYVITQAIEVKLIKQDERDIWVVNMKDDNTYLTVRVDEDGEMEKMQEFEKAK